jgi:hypothetical protein
MLISLYEDRARIKKHKDGVGPNSCTPKGLFKHCLTAQEQCGVGEGIAFSILSLYPRYIQSITRAVGGSPYDLIANLVPLNMIIGIQVKTTAKNLVRLTSNNNNPGTRVAYRPDYSVQHAILVVHADYKYYFIPTKEILKDPEILEKLEANNNLEVKFKLSNYKKFKLKFDYMFIGPLPEALKYEDYWV